MYTRQEREYFQAKRSAARQVTGSDRPTDLPSNAEIRERVQMLAEMLEGPSRRRELRAMRIEALRFLRLLGRWKPRLIGSVLTGHIRQGSDIDLHVFCDSAEVVVDHLRGEGLSCESEQKTITKAGEVRTFRHVRVASRFPVELTVYPAAQSNFPFRSSITGKVIERADERELTDLLRRDDPDADIEEELLRAVEHELTDPYEVFDELLRPLEKVKQSPKHHPEGDALYHSLQVFQIALRVREYDQEFLLAALLHDVGKGIDPEDHVASGVEALREYVTPRTLWLIENHMLAHECHDGTIGPRVRRRLAASPDFEDLLLLSEIDRAGRRGGVIVPSIEEALEAIRRLDE